jgi:hypothetical protein
MIAATKTTKGSGNFLPNFHSKASLSKAITTVGKSTSDRRSKTMAGSVIVPTATTVTLHHFDGLLKICLFTNGKCFLTIFLLFPYLT